MKSREYIYRNKGKTIFIFLVFVAIAIMIWGIRGIYREVFRLDQYAITIFSTTAGIIGTMFGLTAASYAFIWGDLRSDSQENRHLGKVLEHYSKKLWHLFVCSLILTVLVIFTSLIGLALAQHITNPSLFKMKKVCGGVLSEYQNKDFIQISVWTLLNLILSGIAVSAMVWMNWDIFRRNAQYATIAESILNCIREKYDMKLPEKENKNSNSIEYEKIHNIEILVERVLENHESVGNAFAESQRREKLLTAIITNELNASYIVGDKKSNVNSFINKEKIIWEYLEEEKRKSRWEQCNKIADQEYNLLQERENNKLQKKHSPLKPCNCSFITVYDDLILYRDNSLVWEEKQRTLGQKYIEKQEFMKMFEQRALRYTIKKRLLIFYLRGEMFSDMDLSKISFSGADLRFTSFMGCNLTGIRLKGANCEGTDFTNSKMVGMFFADVLENDENRKGEIQLTCIDVPEKDEDAWNPYQGREATRLCEATFKGADVSRAYLKAPGELKGEQDFPFGSLGFNNWELEGRQVEFSLIGTNFDNAKMFFSYFKNIDFTNASLEKSQLYNVGMIQTKAISTNFAGTILTNACIAWCDFENADFSNASLAETILLRVNFKGANMKDVNFSYSNIIACNFEGASCQNASFKNIIQDLERLKNRRPEALKGIELYIPREISFGYATLTNTDFSGSELDNVFFSNAVGQNCIFTKTKGIQTFFDNAIFNSSVFNSTKFEQSSFKNTVLRNSIFTKAFFINSSFYKTDFSESLFSMVDEHIFVGGYMFEADFSNAKGLTAICFSNICLKQVNFKGTGIQEIDFLDNITLIDCIF